MRVVGVVVMLMLGALLGGCSKADVDKASVCAEALGLGDLNPLVDGERLRQRARDKEERLRELAGSVEDQEVAKALGQMLETYVQVQKERLDDATIVGRWAARVAANTRALTAACT